MRHLRRRNHRQGIFVAETIAAIGLMALIAVLLAVAVGRHHRGADRLAGSRAAVNLAEDGLTALQAAQPLPQVPAGATIDVQKLDHPSNVEGAVWASVQTKINGRTATLTGLVRASALEKGSVKP